MLFTFLPYNLMFIKSWHWKTATKDHLLTFCPCFILLFFTVSRKKDSCLFFQFTRHLRNLLKLSKPQQLYNRAKARSKVRKLMVLFCLNTKPVRKKDYPTLSQPWSLLIANHQWVNYFLKDLIHYSPTFFYMIFTFTQQNIIALLFLFSL